MNKVLISPLCSSVPTIFIFFIIAPSLLFLTRISTFFHAMYVIKSWGWLVTVSRFTLIFASVDFNALNFRAKIWCLVQSSYLKNYEMCNDRLWWSFAELFSVQIRFGASHMIFSFTARVSHFSFQFSHLWKSLKQNVSTYVWQSINILLSPILAILLF